MKRFFAILLGTLLIGLSCRASDELILVPQDNENNTPKQETVTTEVKKPKSIYDRLNIPKREKQPAKKTVKIPEYDESEYVIIKPDELKNKSIQQAVDEKKAGLKENAANETKEKSVKKPPIKTEKKVSEQQNKSPEVKTVKNKNTTVKSTETKTAKDKKETEVKSSETDKQQLETEKNKTTQKQEEERKRYKELQELTVTYQQGVALYTDNNLDEALNVFTKIPEDKRIPEIWLLMGNILMDKDKKDEAVFMYGRAILTDSTFYKAYYNLGNIYLNDDKFNMAIEQYKLAGKYNPNNPYVFYNLGCAYIKAGDLKKAKSAFIRALEINNKVPDFHYNLAYTYKKLKKEKLSKIYLDNYNKLTGQID